MHYFDIVLFVIFFTNQKYTLLMEHYIKPHSKMLIEPAVTLDQLQGNSTIQVSIQH